MRRLKLYLETSAWNFLLADDAPEKKQVTIDFFRGLPEAPFEIYVSEFVLEEIERAPDEKREQLMSAIQRHDPEVLMGDVEVLELAESYTEKGALPRSAIVDARHIAIASVNELDLVVSWNLRHIANIRRQERVQAINLLNGYTKPIQLITPMEVSHHDDT